MQEQTENDNGIKSMSLNAKKTHKQKIPAKWREWLATELHYERREKRISWMETSTHRTHNYTIRHTYIMIE